MEDNQSVTLFWFRRDLRLEDNAGLYRALTQGQNVQPVFIFDTNILSHLNDKKDARVAFLHSTVSLLKKELIELGSDLLVYYGNPIDIIDNLVKTKNIIAVYTNHDFGAYPTHRDTEVNSLLEKNNIVFKTYKDHVIFEKDEVVKDDGKPYTVFTPYKKKWLAKLTAKSLDGSSSYYFKSYPTEKYFEKFLKTNRPSESITLQKMGFDTTDIFIPAAEVSTTIIKKYDEQRDFPAIDGTSRLGIHFRFGTISIRKKARKAIDLNATYLSELIWRDFYAQILYHFPHVEKNSFRPEYDQIKWRNNEEEFKAWQEGKTGYPIVDAGMRELMHTGHMHNRVRMIAASFLTKHLLIDWRWGEAWFAEKLLDFDLASNNGGWQWAAGCGTDAAPYFRIFSPDAQTQKFDKNLQYIKKWVPELSTSKYPKPIVDHKLARERCLQTYKEGLNR